MFHFKGHFIQNPTTNTKTLCPCKTDYLFSGRKSLQFQVTLSKTHTENDQFLSFIATSHGNQMQGCVVLQKQKQKKNLLGISQTKDSMLLI